MMKNNKMMKNMENGEMVIGMLHHVTIGLRYRSRECTLSLLVDALLRPTSPPIFLHHLCIFLLIVASPRWSALVAPIPESDDHVM